MVCFYVILSNTVCHSFYHSLILNLVNPKNPVQASFYDSCLFDHLLKTYKLKNFGYDYLLWSYSSFQLNFFAYDW